MTNHPVPYKTFFIVCYSTVAAIVATEAGLLGNSDAYFAELSNQELVEEFEMYLAENKEHPWCGFGRMDDIEVGYLVPAREGDVHFINEEEYEQLTAERLKKG